MAITLPDYPYLDESHVDKDMAPPEIKKFRLDDLKALRQTDEYQRAVGHPQLKVFFISDSKWFEGRAHIEEWEADQTPKGTYALPEEINNIPLQTLIWQNHTARVAFCEDRIRLLRAQDPAYFKDPWTYKIIWPVRDLLIYNGKLHNAIERAIDGFEETSTNAPGKILAAETLQREVSRIIIDSDLMNSASLLSIDEEIQKLTRTNKDAYEILHAHPDRVVPPVLANHPDLFQEPFPMIITNWDTCRYENNTTLELERQRDRAKSWLEALTRISNHTQQQTT